MIVEMPAAGCAVQVAAPGDPTFTEATEDGRFAIVIGDPADDAAALSGTLPELEAFARRLLATLAAQ